MAAYVGVLGLEHPLHPCAQSTKMHGITEAERGGLKVSSCLYGGATYLVCHKKISLLISVGVEIPETLESRSLLL